jgi:copper chaperone CopZ
MAQEATVQVLGMTCNSCVQNIEGVMGDRPGIESIRVSLADEEAVVRYDPAQWTPHAIADAIDDVCVTLAPNLNELSFGSKACDEIYTPRCEMGSDGLTQMGFEAHVIVRESNKSSIGRGWPSGERAPSFTRTSSVSLTRYGD